MLLLTIYKPFIRPHLDYGDIIYDQAYNASFHQKLGSIQYNAALAIMRAIRGRSKGKLYCELGLEPFEKEDGAGNCVTFLRFSDKNAQSTYWTIPTSASTYNTRNTNNISEFKVKHNFFQSSFFSFCGNRMEQTGPYS